MQAQYITCYLTETPIFLLSVFTPKCMTLMTTKILYLNLKKLFKNKQNFKYSKSKPE